MGITEISVLDHDASQRIEAGFSLAGFEPPCQDGSPVAFRYQLSPKAMVNVFEQRV